MFLDLVLSHLVLSQHAIGPFATLYFSHLIDPAYLFFFSSHTKSTRTLFYISQLVPLPVVNSFFFMILTKKIDQLL